MPWRFAARWAVDLLGGLAVIHNNGFIHRDVKPANIMILGPAPGAAGVAGRQSAKLLDFGAVKQAADAKPGAPAASASSSARASTPRRSSGTSASCPRRTFTRSAQACSTR